MQSDVTLYFSLRWSRRLNMFHPFWNCLPRLAFCGFVHRVQAVTDHCRIADQFWLKWSTDQNPHSMHDCCQDVIGFWFTFLMKRARIACRSSKCKLYKLIVAIINSGQQPWVKLTIGDSIKVIGERPSSWANQDRLWSKLIIKQKATEVFNNSITTVVTAYAIHYFVKSTNSSVNETENFSSSLSDIVLMHYLKL
jgi:hypothetical protein